MPASPHTPKTNWPPIPKNDPKLHTRLFNWDREKKTGKMKHDDETIFVVRGNLKLNVPPDTDLTGYWVEYYACHIGANTRGGRHRVITMAKVLTPFQVKQLQLEG